MVNEFIKFFSVWSLISEDTKKFVKLELSWDGVEKKRQKKVKLYLLSKFGRLLIKYMDWI